MHIDIPSSWQNSLLDRLKNLACNEESLQIYGALPAAFPTGRPDDVPDLEMNSAIEHFQYARQLNIETNYLLNGFKGAEYFSKHQERVGEYFSWITQQLCPDIITVSDPELQILLNREYGWESFCVSAIAGIRDLRGMEQWLKTTKDFGTVHSLVLHHDLTQRKLHEIRELVEGARNHGIRTKLMMTESCYGGCGARQAHYAFIGQDPGSRPTLDTFQVSCMLKRLHDPVSLLDWAGFISPEELHSVFSKTGIYGFKITGRSCSADWVSHTSAFYFVGRSPRNLFEIIVFTAPLLRESFGMGVDQLFYLDSEAYRQYIAQARNLLPYDRMAFTHETAARLFSLGQLKINDPGAIYRVIGGKLTLDTLGEYATILGRQVSMLTGPNP